MKKIICLTIALLVISACNDEHLKQTPKIIYIKYVCSKTVDNQLWLNLTAIVNPAGLQIKDAGFLMGNVDNDATLHFSWSEITIVPCEFLYNKVIYDDIALDGSRRSTYIKPYFVFEDGTEIYGSVVYMYDGREVEEEY